MRTLIIIGALWIVHGFPPRNAVADIIIDDFDDPASVISPEKENVWVTNLGVGPFDAERNVRIAASGTDPDARIDIVSSTFRAEVGDVHRTDDLTPLTAIQVSYEFEFADFTSGNALFVDFQSVQGSVPPDFLRILILDDQIGSSFFDTFSPISIGGAFWRRQVPIATLQRWSNTSAGVR